MKHMSKIKPTIFRAYDIRGLYPQELNEKAAELIALAYVKLFSHTEKLVVARDPRHNSEGLAQAIIKTLADSGREVIDLGIAPDPLFYFAIFHYQYDGGFMISGSHNPPEYSGLTLAVRRPGQELSEDVIEKELDQIKELAEKVDIELAGKPGRIRRVDLSEEYIDYVIPKIHLKRPLKIVLDSSNGAVGYLPEKVFKKLGCQVQTLYGEFDGNFPHHLPDPYVAEYRRDLQKAVLEKGADVGFMYDGDGDRVAPIDNRGRMVNGDFCLLLLAKQALQKKKGPVVHDMRVSKAFIDEMTKEGVKTYFSVSHHNAVIDKILKTGAVFGGEITLHFLFPLDYYLCDEAIFASLKLAEIVSEHDDFAAFVDTLPRYHTSPEIFIDSTDEEKFKLIVNLQQYLRENKYEFIDIDGARISFPHGWALARAANTTPIIKCRFEADTPEHLIEIEKLVLDIFRKVGIPVNKKTLQELGLD
jgi:phosphomannomutase/phosphoglucomutase